MKTSKLRILKNFWKLPVPTATFIFNKNFQRVANRFHWLFEKKKMKKKRNVFSESPWLEDLPPELIQQIFLYCDKSFIVKTGFHICSNFYYILDSNTMWFQLCHLCKLKKTQGKSYKEIFVKYYLTKILFLYHYKKETNASFDKIRCGFERIFPGLNFEKCCQFMINGHNLLSNYNNGARKDGYPPNWDSKKGLKVSSGERLVDWRSEKMLEEFRKFSSIFVFGNGCFNDEVGLGALINKILNEDTGCVIMCHNIIAFESESIPDIWRESFILSDRRISFNDTLLSFFGHAYPDIGLLVETDRVLLQSMMKYRKMLVHPDVKLKYSCKFESNLKRDLEEIYCGSEFSKLFEKRENEFVKPMKGKLVNFDEPNRDSTRVGGFWESKNKEEAPIFAENLICRFIELNAHLEDSTVDLVFLLIRYLMNREKVIKKTFKTKEKN